MGRNVWQSPHPAALLAAEMGFGGDSFTLDAACASSIYAVKLACDALTAGRADMIVSGGENVFPQEIEDVLLAEEGIADAAVVGAPDEDFGQRFLALVVRRPLLRWLLAAGLLVVSTHVPLGREVLSRGIIFIDLAIAHLAESRLSGDDGKLSGGQWETLVARCREIQKSLATSPDLDEDPTREPELAELETLGELKYSKATGKPILANDPHLDVGVREPGPRTVGALPRARPGANRGLRRDRSGADIARRLRVRRLRSGRTDTVGRTSHRGIRGPHRRHPPAPA